MLSNDQQWAIQKVVDTEDACQQARTTLAHDLDEDDTKKQATARTAGQDYFYKNILFWHCLPIGVHPRDDVIR
jgi:hypothetical protein